MLCAYLNAIYSPGIIELYAAVYQIKKRTVVSVILFSE